MFSVVDTWWTLLACCGNWTTRGYANSRIANSRTGHLADWTTRGYRVLNVLKVDSETDVGLIIVVRQHRT